MKRMFGKRTLAANTLHLTNTIVLRTNYGTTNLRKAHPRAPATEAYKMRLIFRLCFCVCVSECEYIRCMRFTILARSKYECRYYSMRTPCSLNKTTPRSVFAYKRLLVVATLPQNYASQPGARTTAVRIIVCCPCACQCAMCLCLCV